MQRLVEAEHGLDFLDDLGVEPTGAAIRGISTRIASALRSAGPAAGLFGLALSATGKARRRIDPGALDLRDHLLDRAAGCELHHGKIDHHDRE